MPLRDFDPALFLRDYWQKKPLLIRNAWMDWRNPLDPDAMAGLACEDGVEARLVTRSGTQWALEHGPFAAERFARLDPTHWTLLVQAVDQMVPDVAALVEPFRFLPNWRIDDVMVSYAADGGGVGAHYDQYDVFLIQGLGRRRWQIGAECDAASPLRPHDGLRLLAQFDPVEDWVLEPGDILYLPPRVAHHGVAVGDDCMTYSIGFRAPSHSELLAHFCDHLLADMADDDRYGDPDLTVPANPGEIAPAALERLFAMATDRLRDRTAFARWFGGYATQPKYPDEDWSRDTPIAPATVRTRLAAGEALCRNPAGRFAFVRDPGGAGHLFVDGTGQAVEAAVMPFVEALCARPSIRPDAAWAGVDGIVALATRLIDRGNLGFEDDLAQEEADDDEAPSSPDDFGG